MNLLLALRHASKLIQLFTLEPAARMLEFLIEERLEHHVLVEGAEQILSNAFEILLQELVDVFASYDILLRQQELILANLLFAGEH